MNTEHVNNVPKAIEPVTRNISFDFGDSEPTTAGDIVLVFIATFFMTLFSFKGLVAFVAGVFQ